MFSSKANQDIPFFPSLADLMNNYWRGPSVKQHHQQISSSGKDRWPHEAICWGKPRQRNPVGFPRPSLRQCVLYNGDIHGLTTSNFFIVRPFSKLA
eukprot:2411623-Amphidinium_carterae.1